MEEEEVVKDLCQASASQAQAITPTTTAIIPLHMLSTSKMLIMIYSMRHQRLITTND